ncbi:MAG TPA: response regulator [Actinomycetota bacterium]|nr:response regulator [Actinomycetota bacterium]
MDETAEALRVLLVSGDAATRERLRAGLPAGVGLRDTGRLTDALVLLGEDQTDLVLLDLFLPDATGLAAYRSLGEHAAGLPVLVLAPAGDEAAAHAVAEGARDHLVTEPFDAEGTARVLRHAVAEARLIAEVRRLALLDQATGLLTAQTLAAIGPYLLALAGRNGQDATLLRLTVEAAPGAEEAPDRPERELALAAVARVMRRTFRAADVLARLGPCELVVLFLHDGDDRAVLARFQDALAALDSPSRPWRLALRAGAARSGPGEASFAALTARSASAARASQPWLAPRFGAEGASAAGSEDRQ